VKKLPLLKFIVAAGAYTWRHTCMSITTRHLQKPFEWHTVLVVRQGGRVVQSRYQHGVSRLVTSSTIYWRLA